MGFIDLNGGYALRLRTNGVADDRMAVLCGDFLPPLTNLGPCKYEAWVAPASGEQGIILATGVGGLHAELLEFTNAGPGTPNYLYFNMFFTDPGNGISGTSYDSIMPGEPAHIALIYDGGVAGFYGANVAGYVYLFVNGLCAGRFACPNGGYFRQSQNTASGGVLCWGSNGHAAGGLDIQQGRAWDGTAADPAVLPILGGTYEVPIPPESIMGGYSVQGDGSLVACNFLMHFFVPDCAPADKSPLGLLGKFHPGTLCNMKETNGLITGGAGNVWPRPSYVRAPLFPSGLVVTPRTQPKMGLPASAQPTPPSVAGSLITADDFSDGWNTYAFDNGVYFPEIPGRIPQLGPTKYGTILPYQQKHCYTSITGPAPWGTDNSGNAVMMSPTPAAATVDLGVADFDVMVERVGPASDSGTNGELGIAFRQQSANNMFVLKAFYNAFDGETPYVVGYKVVNGSEDDFDGAVSFYHPTPNDTWRWLRVLVKGTTFKVYIGSGSGGSGTWTQVGSNITGQTTFQSATRAGLLSWGLPVTRQSTRTRIASLSAYTAP